MVLCFSRASHSSRLPSILPSVAAACFLLVVVYNFLLGSHLRPRPILFLVFRSLLIHRLVQRDNTPPHTFHPGYISSQRPLSPSTPTFGWLLSPPLKLRPSKAKGPPISLFFHRLIRPPKRQAAVLPTCSNPALPLLQCTL